MKVSSILHSRPLGNGKHQIKIRIYNNNKNTFINTNYSIDKSQWDNSKRRVKESKKFPEGELINIELNRLESLYKGDSNQSIVKNIIPFDFNAVIGFFDYHINLLKTQEKYGTYRKFEVVKRYLVDFQSSNQQYLYINVDFLMNFEIYLYKNTKVKQNGVHAYFKTFRNIINKCITYDSIKFPPQNNPFLNFKIKLNVVEKPKLSVNQLNKIIEVDLSNDKDLDEVKKYFLFSYYSCGMRISDLLTLKWGNLKDGRLIYTMRKTSKKISLPINKNQVSILLSYLSIDDIDKLKNELTSLGEKVTEMFSSYNTRISDFMIKPLKDYKKSIKQTQNETMGYKLIELMSNKKPNDYVFNILDKRKINSKTDLLKQISSKSAVINRRLKKVSIKSEVGENITFHTSRHTFSDLMRRSGKSIYDISKVLGHSDISITEKYLKSLDYDSTDNSLLNFYD